MIKHKSIIIYGAALAALVFVLKWLEWRMLIFDHSMEVYMGAIALIFTSLGIWLALKLTKPKIERVIVEKTIFVESKREPDLKAAAEIDLSQRELEVLELMAEGLSNQEIADKLYVSLNTIKTHSSRIFEKMDVKRRTQAVEMAKRMRII